VPEPIRRYAGGVLLRAAIASNRRKGQQKVTVEHVHVHEGGQAIVVHVEHKREGGREKIEDQPHAKQVADAPQSPV
jgi:hypothetical protein